MTSMYALAGPRRILYREIFIKQRSIPSTVLMQMAPRVMASVFPRPER